MVLSLSSAELGDLGEGPGPFAEWCRGEQPPKIVHIQILIRIMNPQVIGISKTFNQHTVPGVSLKKIMPIGSFSQQKTHRHIYRNKETVMTVWDQDWPAGSSLTTNSIPRALCNSCVCWTYCLERSNKISQAENPYTPKWRNKWMPSRNTEFGG